MLIYQKRDRCRFLGILHNTPIHIFISADIHILLFAPLDSPETTNTIFNISIIIHFAQAPVLRSTTKSEGAKPLSPQCGDRRSYPEKKGG